MGIGIFKNWEVPDSKLEVFDSNTEHKMAHTEEVQSKPRL